MLAETEQLDRLRSGVTKLEPLLLEQTTPEAELRTRPGQRADAVIVGSYRGRRYVFVVECKARSTPKVFTAALAQVQALADPPRTYPMVMMPFLTRRQLLELEAAEVSGIDACGNGVVVVPGELLVLRTGQPNKFPDSRPLKNAYRGDASLVARAFVLISEYSRVSDIRDEIRDRDGQLALSTVSKALKRLEDDLVVERSRGCIRRLQGDKLLEKLVANYNGPRISTRCLGKTLLAPEQLMKKLTDISRENETRISATGLSSVNRYAPMGREAKIAVYCSTMAPVFNALSVREEIEVTDRFPNVELIETRSEIAFFDARVDDSGFPWASPIQTYLELMQGDLRDQETAQQAVKTFLPDWNAEYKWSQRDR